MDISQSPPKVPKTLMSRQSSMAEQFVSFHWEVAEFRVDLFFLKNALYPPEKITYCNKNWWLGELGSMKFPFEMVLVSADNLIFVIALMIKMYFLIHI